MAKKICTSCHKWKGLKQFYRCRRYGHQAFCKNCSYKVGATWRQSHLKQDRLRKRRDGALYPEQRMLIQVRHRAKTLGRLCTIVEADIVIPKKCPILGIRLFHGKGKFGPNSPTLDRKNNKKGYVPGNVQVISHRANVMKNDASPKDLRAFAAWVRRTL